MTKEKEIGVVFKYFEKPQVAAIKLLGTIKVGDTIHIKGATTDFEQEVESMQIENTSVEEAKSGESIGIKVEDRVRPNDKIYKVQE